MVMVVSCGVILLAPAREVFVCHATGSARWDLPKGVIDDGEQPRATAVREAWEESGLRLEPAALADLGEFSYLSAKRLHLFALRVSRDAFDVGDCRCRSWFSHHLTGRPTPEADAFAWKPLAEMSSWCGKGLAKVLGRIAWAPIERLPEVTAIEVDTATPLGP